VPDEQKKEDTKEQEKKEEKPKETDEEKQKKQLEELKSKIKKEKDTKVQNAAKMLDTREKIERDYEEDLLVVAFQSSSKTKRAVEAKRPTQEEMMTIMRLSAESAIYEGRTDPDSLSRMVDIYDKLPELAAELSVDKTLDKMFWKKKVSFGALQSFITELIKETQRGFVTADELEKFR